MYALVLDSYMRALCNPTTLVQGRGTDRCITVLYYSQALAFAPDRAWCAAERIALTTIQWKWFEISSYTHVTAMTWRTPTSARASQQPAAPWPRRG